jgi:hypothetical protein
MKRTQAAQLALKHLQLSREPLLLTPRSTKTPAADHPGPVLEMTPRRRGGGWMVEVWLTAVAHLSDPRPLADHRLWVQDGGDIEVEDVDPAKRRRGRRRIHPEGVAQAPRLHITPVAEDLAEIQRLAQVHGLTESAVGAALWAKALRGVPLPW